LSGGVAWLVIFDVDMRFIVFLLWLAGENTSVKDTVRQANYVFKRYLS
jgi:hypothetical protein